MNAQVFAVNVICHRCKQVSRAPNVDRLLAVERWACPHCKHPNYMTNRERWEARMQRGIMARSHANQVISTACSTFFDGWTKAVFFGENEPKRDDP